MIHPKAAAPALFSLLLQAAVGLAVFILGRLIVCALPMVKEIPLPLKFNLAELLAAVMLTGLIVVLYRLAFRLNLYLKHKTGLPQIGQLARLLFLAASVLIGYFAYLPLLAPYLGRLNWIYNLFFLLLFLVVLGMLMYISIRYGAETALILWFERRQTGGRTGRWLPCDGGGTIAVAHGVPGRNDAPASPAGPGRCPGCGGETRAGARFCTRCGAALAPAGTSPAAAAFTACSACGARLRTGAACCAACGAAQT